MFSPSINKNKAITTTLMTQPSCFLYPVQLLFLKEILQLVDGKLRSKSVYLQVSMPFQDCSERKIKTEAYEESFLTFVSVEPTFVS